MTYPIVKARVENEVVVEAYLVWSIPDHMKDWITAPVEVGPNLTYDGEVFYPPSE